MERGKLTIREIAEICGVAVSTVSRALNNHPDINTETKDKIFSVINEYGYVPNNSARNLKRADAKTIAVLVKGITNPFFADMIKIFEQECGRRAYSLILQHVEEKQDEVAVALMLEKEKRLNGLVFLGGNFSHASERLARLQSPFVLSTVAIMEPKVYRDYAYVAVDDVRESRKLVEYLLGGGRRRIAIICADEADQSIGALRLKGYLEALAAAGIARDEALILRPCHKSVYTFENGYDCAQALLASGSAFDAVYGISDTLAIGAMRALKDAGLDIPAQVAVAGFDGLELGRYLCPRLTSLKQPDEAMALETMEALFEQLGQNPPGKRQRLFEGSLRLGEST